MSFSCLCFDLVSPIVCLCGVITRLYLLSFIKQLCSIIVCLLPKLSLDIRFWMMCAKIGG